MTNELATILTRLDLAYDNLLTTAIQLHNLAKDTDNPDHDHFSKGDQKLVNDMVDNLEALVKKEVR
jgi:DNA relaxase NicK